jgi:hypothetical protein
MGVKWYRATYPTGRLPVDGGLHTDGLAGERIVKQFHREGFALRERPG